MPATRPSAVFLRSGPARSCLLVLTLGFLIVAGVALVVVGLKEIVQQHAMVGRYQPEEYAGQDAIFQGIGYILVGMIPLMLGGWFSLRFHRQKKR